MADTKLYTVAAAMQKATDIQAALALSKVRFFDDSLVVGPNTVKADMTAVEVDYDGYTAGGLTLTAWSAPLKDPNGGAVITSPLKHIAIGTPSDPPKTAVVGGYWIEDADGNVRLVAQYDPPRILAVPGDGWEWVEQIVEGRN